MTLVTDRVQGVGNRLSRGNDVHLYPRGVFQDVIRQHPNVFRHGGREEEGLPLGRDVPKQATNVGQKAHVTHAVSLVQHQDFHFGEVHLSFVDQVEQASRTGNDDFGPALRGRDLWYFADAAIDGRTANLRLALQPNSGLINLFCQFTGGGNDEGTVRRVRR